MEVCCGIEAMAVPHCCSRTRIGVYDCNAQRHSWRAGERRLASAGWYATASRVPPHSRPVNRLDSRSDLERRRADNLVRHRAGFDIVCNTEIRRQHVVGQEVHGRPENAFRREHAEGWRYFSCGRWMPKWLCRAERSNQGRLGRRTADAHVISTRVGLLNWSQGRTAQPSLEAGCSGGDTRIGGMQPTRSLSSSLVSSHDAVKEFVWRVYRLPFRQGEFHSRHSRSGSSGDIASSSDRKAATVVHSSRKDSGLAYNVWGGNCRRRSSSRSSSSGVQVLIRPPRDRGRRRTRCRPRVDLDASAGGISAAERDYPEVDSFGELFGRAIANRAVGPWVSILTVRPLLSLHHNYW